MKMTLPVHSFDGFILEFYGNQPSEEYTLKMQQELARILNSEGKGIIITQRKKYASYWYLGNSTLPPDWRQRLIIQADSDLFYRHDGTGDHLVYGLYSRYHTIESLKRELGYTFNIIECNYEKDPRYVVCVVSGKDKQGNYNNLSFKFETDASEKWDYDIAETEKIVSTIETVCNILNIQKNILECSPKNTYKIPLQEIKAPIIDFLFLFEELFKYISITA